MHAPPTWSRVTLFKYLAFPMRTLLRFSSLLAALLAAAAMHADDESAPILDLLPDGLNVIGQSPSGVEGLSLVEISDGSFLYVFEDKPFFFSGDLFEMTDAGVNNLSEAYRSGQRIEILGAIDPQDAVVFPATRKRIETLWVFTDVTCGYCRLFHEQMAEYNDLGLEVRYLAFPRHGMESDSSELLETAWCAKDRQRAITRLKSGEKLSAKTCENSVAEQFELGQRLGVRGTPAIFSATGVELPGFVPPDQIMERLGLASAQSEAEG